MPHVITVFALICLLSLPLNACINDSATYADEQQFVSGYDQHGKKTGHRVGETVTSFHPGVLLLILPSIVLLGIAYIWVRQEKQIAEKRQQRLYRQASR